ncbi:hypothetical protein JRO89_XS10G0178600 [Xanthoceras sorbifolium]|uniref:Uncharacterized protein n=1 Tax=Xanthoceras sorbifolium TaxID=99658 RepID=A0ABQ8HJ81_9ROSI|nr:hypothetical protein JRO89_XS10G0178600 [Xanthoceras sorbifolium]
MAHNQEEKQNQLLVVASWKLATGVFLQTGNLYQHHVDRTGRGTILEHASQALDTNREYYELGLLIIQKAGVAHKIDFREGPALPFIDQNVSRHLIELVKVGGVIGYDNNLSKGAVTVPPDVPLRKYMREFTDLFLELNKVLAVDPRIEICQLPCW